jgi:hypothetical protein
MDPLVELHIMVEDPSPFLLIVLLNIEEVPSIENYNDVNGKNKSKRKEESRVEDSTLFPPAI